jgi:hypothetical protein
MDETTEKVSTLLHEAAKPITPSKREFGADEGWEGRYAGRLVERLGSA